VKYRDGEEALEAARHAWELSEPKDPYCLAVLAAAHAELGDFDKAMSCQKQALGFPDYERTHGTWAAQVLKRYERHEALRVEP
jgi:hypothetical protein